MMTGMICDTVIMIGFGGYNSKLGIIPKRFGSASSAVRFGLRDVHISITIDNGD
jgi:hypothetical protein